MVESQSQAFRLFARERQTKNPLIYNANRQYHENNTAAWQERYRDKLSSVTEAVSKEARRRLDTREADEALEQIAIATEERAVTNREERDKRHKKAEDEKARLDKIPQQTDLAWPRTKGVTNRGIHTGVNKSSTQLNWGFSTFPSTGP